jgi:hypothetical protein
LTLTSDEETVAYSPSVSISFSEIIIDAGTG